ncbi:MAG: HAD domain-containing protein [Patescibacteria group bacterium]
MKIIFLDIDGVLNSNQSKGLDPRFPIDPHLASHIERIKENTGAEIVLSSSWRHSDEGISAVEKYIGKIHDITPTVDNGFRGDEINAYLDNHPNITQHAIIDDSSDFHPDQPLFQISAEEGLTEEVADDIAAHFASEKYD